jgi:hypothetical protein
MMHLPSLPFGYLTKYLTYARNDIDDIDLRIALRILLVGLYSFKKSWAGGGCSANSEIYKHTHHNIHIVPMNNYI